MLKLLLAGVGVEELPQFQIIISDGLGRHGTDLFQRQKGRHKEEIVCHR